MEQINWKFNKYNGENRISKEENQANRKKARKNRKKTYFTMIRV